jgi:hypothetical protein
MRLFLPNAPVKSPSTVLAADRTFPGDTPALEAVIVDFQVLSILLVFVLYKTMFE